MDEIKEQLAIYSRLYYNKRRNDEKYRQRKGNLRNDTIRKRRFANMKLCTISRSAPMR